MKDHLRCGLNVQLNEQRETDEYKKQRSNEESLYQVHLRGLKPAINARAT